MGTFGTYTGDMNIPDEKKKLFKQQMSRLLNLGGMDLTRLGFSQIFSILIGRDRQLL